MFLSTTYIKKNFQGDLSDISAIKPLCLQLTADASITSEAVLAKNSSECTPTIIYCIDKKDIHRIKVSRNISFNFEESFTVGYVGGLHTCIT